jgi:hypothetical protein
MERGGRERSDYGIDLKKYMLTKNLWENLWQIETFNGKGFLTSTGIINISSGQETDIFLFRNPVGSGKMYRIKDVAMTLVEASGANGTVRIYRNPTITAEGTPLAISKIRNSQITTSTAQAFFNPTISARGTLLQEIQLSGSETFIRDMDLGRYIEEGADPLLVTYDGSANNQTFGLVVSWLEV